eukprot:2758103-Rhodomonas_salina.1
MFEIHDCCLGDALAYIKPTNEGCQNWIEMLQHNNITFDLITRLTQGSKPCDFIIHLQSVAVNKHTQHLYSQESSETRTRHTEMINDVLRSEERLLKTYEHTAQRTLVPPYGDLKLKFNTVVGIIMNLAAGMDPNEVALNGHSRYLGSMPWWTPKFPSTQAGYQEMSKSHNVNNKTDSQVDPTAQSYVAIGIATKATEAQEREEPELCVEDPLNYSLSILKPGTRAILQETDMMSALQDKERIAKLDLRITELIQTKSLLEQKVKQYVH